MSATTSGASPEGVAADGRRTRWEGHRAARREELVDATLRAIRDHGALVGMDDIAAAAGTSKTVFYRHFHDRAGLYRAVSARVDTLLLRDITGALGGGNDEELSASPRSARSVIAAAIDAYLQLVERQPEVYRFIVAAPLVQAAAGSVDGVRGVSHAIATQLGDLITSSLGTGKDAAHRDMTWGHAIVGMVRATAEEWLQAGCARSGMTREHLTADLTALIWSGLSGASRAPS